MSITVRDILSLDLFRSARVLAGERGLERQVERVNFTDCPIKFDDQEYSLVGRGDFYICSLYFIKDDPQKIADALYFYMMTESSGCVIIDEYFAENGLPEQVIALAQRNKYPVLMIPGNVQYGDMIRDISELLLVDRSDMVTENKLGRLMHDSLTARDASAMARYLNGQFKSHYATAFFRAPSLDSRAWRSLCAALRAVPEVHPLRYQSGAFLVFNYNERRTLREAAERVAATAATFCELTLGISGEFTQPQRMGECLQQAVSAHEMGVSTGERTAYYTDMSLYSILYAVREQSCLRDFCERMLAPLREYGQRHNVELLRTVECYLRCDGDTKRTAAALFTHENTVRFRIAKAKSLLGLEDAHVRFIEQMSVALKGVKLY